MWYQNIIIYKLTQEHHKIIWKTSHQSEVKYEENMAFQISRPYVVKIDQMISIQHVIPLVRYQVTIIIFPFKEKYNFIQKLFSGCGIGI